MIKFLSIRKYLNQNIIRIEDEKEEIVYTFKESLVHELNSVGQIVPFCIIHLQKYNFALRNLQPDIF